MDLYIGALGITVVGRHRRGVILRDGHIVAAGENENDLNHYGLYSNKTVIGPNFCLSPPANKTLLKPFLLRTQVFKEIGPCRKSL
jgi:hypothetical protein